MTNILDNYNLRINNIINSYDKLLFRNPNIKYIGRSFKIINNTWTKEPCLTFYVKNKFPIDTLNYSELIPNYFFGAKTDIIQLPSPEKYSKNNLCSIPKLSQNNFKKGPISAGDVVTNVETNSRGTLTCALSEIFNQENIYALSCNHVLTRNIGEFLGRGKIGDKIYGYHGPINSSDEDYQYLGKLYNVAPIYYYKNREEALLPSSKISPYDAAICYVGKNTKATQQKLIRAGLNDGNIISGIVDVNIKDNVYAIGALSGAREGTVLALNVKEVFDEPGKPCSIHSDGILTSITTEPGDSGALGYIKKSGKIFTFGMNVGDTSNLSYFLRLDMALFFFKLNFLKPL